MTMEELEESIQWEAEQYIPFDINDVNIDVQLLDAGDDPGQMEVLLVAARKELVSEYQSLIHQAGLKPVVVDVDAFAVANMFEPATAGSRTLSRWSTSEPATSRFTSSETARHVHP